MELEGRLLVLILYGRRIVLKAVLALKSSIYTVLFLSENAYVFSLLILCITYDPENSCSC